MANSTIKTQKYVATTLAPNVTQYENKALGLGGISFTGYSVSSASVGNAGAIPMALPQNAYIPVSVLGQGIAVMRIATNGVMTLMSATLGEYVTGSVYGTSWFAIN